MSNHIAMILREWYSSRDDKDWAMGVVYKTFGPCYRKAGAIMLLSDAGDRLGLLSGGCLEADIQLKARKVIQADRSIVITYDGTDEDDISFQLGIGCGGIVDIALYPLHANNDYLGLQEAYAALQERKAGVLTLSIPLKSDEPYSNFKILNQVNDLDLARYYTSADSVPLLDIVIQNPPHLLVVGGGSDAIPVVLIANALGWEVTVWDSRPANARPEHFGKASKILDMNVEELGEYATAQKVSGVILMSHNIALDAAALLALKNTSLKYLGLLGPLSRRENVLQCVNLVDSDVATSICGPAGYKLGGELPEAIAMSILAQCHAQIYAQ